LRTATLDVRQGSTPRPGRGAVPLGGARSLCDRFVSSNALAAAAAGGCAVSVCHRLRQRRRCPRSVASGRVAARAVLERRGAPEELLAVRDGALWQRCLVTLSSEGARARAVQAELEPDALATYFLEHGALSVDLTWCGSLQDLSTALGRKPQEPPLPDALSLLRPPPGAGAGGVPPKAYVDLFWNGITLDVVWSGQGLTAAVEEAGVRLLGSSEALTVTEIKMEDEHWASAVREQSYPELLGKILVAHTQHVATDVEQMLASQSPPPLLLTLEVGSGFGFGEHPTTRLCMRWLQAREEALRGKCVLDYGCGTGVLGLSSLLLGASAATGIDCDLTSLLLAQANASRNELSLELYAAPDADKTEWTCVSFYAPSEGLRGERVFPPGPPSDRRFDVAVSNMTQKPLKRVAKHLVGAVKPGGLVALSGLRVEHVPGIVKEYASLGVDLQQDSTDDGWVLLSGRKAA